MYVVSECAVCVVLTLVVAICLFGLCVICLLLQEALRKLRFLVGRIIHPSRPQVLEHLMLRLVPASRDDKASTRNVSILATLALIGRTPGETAGHNKSGHSSPPLIMREV